MTSDNKIVSALKTPGGYEILLFLKENPRSRYVDLIRRFRYGRITAYYLKQLVDCGIIQKEESKYPEGRRPYSLTPRGHEIIKTIDEYLEIEREEIIL